MYFVLLTPYSLQSFALTLLLERRNSHPVFKVPGTFFSARIFFFFFSFLFFPYHRVFAVLFVAYCNSHLTAHYRPAHALTPLELCQPLHLKVISASPEQLSLAKIRNQGFIRSAVKGHRVSCPVRNTIGSRGAFLAITSLLAHVLTSAAKEATRASLEIQIEIAQYTYIRQFRTPLPSLGHAILPMHAYKHEVRHGDIK